MEEHSSEGDNHNAPVFAECYRRMGAPIPQLIEEGFTRSPMGKTAG
jgi:hypothetical protein